MKKKQLYTAVGHLERRNNTAGCSCPVIILGDKEYMVDLQEMMIWAALSWRIENREMVSHLYEQACVGNQFTSARSFDACLDRLVMRGLLVAGTGETDYDALYDLLSSLYIAPVNDGIGFRLSVFCSLVLLKHIPFAAAKKVLTKDKRTPREKQIMSLAKQSLLSSAEIIKCMEKNVRHLPDEESILEHLYDDPDTTSENIGYMVKTAPSSKSVIMAIANLYLRRQIIFERI